MRFEKTIVDGCFVISQEPRGDERGFFARWFCATEFAAQGLKCTIAQANNSFSAQAGTLRGLHYQIVPSAEAKLVRCIGGSAYDVVLDLRSGSPTFGKWAGETLTGENRRMMYVPEGCAHGFLTLADDTEMLYLASAPYDGSRERVLRWNDSRFAIEWPRQPVLLSEKDRTASNYDSEYHDPGI
jgi:dTDP-4-dehydrorhamnose 3,5-epimerase